MPESLTPPDPVIAPQAAAPLSAESTASSIDHGPEMLSAAPAGGPLVPLRPLPIWLLLIVALLAAGISWPFVNRFADAFPNPGLDEDMTNRIRADRNDPIAWAKDRELRLLSLTRNAALNYGFFGLCLGASLGLVAAKSAGGSVASVLRSAALGLVLGAIGGAVGGFATGRVALEIDYPNGPDTSIRSMVMHAPGWGLVGLACGAAVSFASGRRLAPLLLGGAVGGALAAVVYEQLAAVLMQLDRSDLPVPEGSANRLLFLACLAAAVAACMGLSNSSRRKASAPAQAAT